MLLIASLSCNLSFVKMKCKIQANIEMTYKQIKGKSHLFRTPWHGKKQICNFKYQYSLVKSIDVIFIQNKTISSSHTCYEEASNSLCIDIRQFRSGKSPIIVFQNFEREKKRCVNKAHKRVVGQFQVKHVTQWSFCCLSFEPKFVNNVFHRERTKTSKMGP